MTSGHVSLPAAIRDRGSPVHEYLSGRYGAGLRGVQRGYRRSAPELAVPPRGGPAGTVATAADWLLRFLLHPAPDLDLVLAGARACGRAGLDVQDAVAALTRRLGLPGPLAPAPVRWFTGPAAGSAAEPGLLARACWSFALLTEAYRAGPRILRRSSPLGRLRGQAVSDDDLLALAPGNALAELAGLRAVFGGRLLPALAARPGRWALGPVFAAGPLTADADLVASGLLLRLKVTVNRGLAADEVFGLVGCALLDAGDEYAIRDVALFSGRTGQLAEWGLADLLSRLAGQPVSVPAARAEFQHVLRG